MDVDNDFRPLYVLDADKKQHIGKLKKLLKEADTLYLATDEDREGESIAWHLHEVLAPKVPVKRMVFHEITKRAIQEAIERPREIDRRLVDAQEARRILDRLYGYEVSPVLWKKVSPGLSAGRVQSVATRMIVERERLRMRFPQGHLLGSGGHAGQAGRRRAHRAADGPRRKAPRLRQGLRPRGQALARRRGARRSGRPEAGRGSSSRRRSRSPRSSASPTGARPTRRS
ncbi:MAG: DNA topoisomerase [Sandaracinaceae bacterium]|nr:DNA topoisomerase [Sandaracinaceae bacterium]